MPERSGGFGPHSWALKDIIRLAPRYFIYRHFSEPEYRDTDMGDINEKAFLKQAELAERWGCSQSTIINYRNKGLISYFQLPESTKVLYPVAEVLEIERKYTKNNSKPKGGDRKKAEAKKVKPCVSPNKDW